jgi:hypothetical protein
VAYFTTNKLEEDDEAIRLHHIVVQLSSRAFADVPSTVQRLLRPRSPGHERNQHLQLDWNCELQRFSATILFL